MPAKKTISVEDSILDSIKKCLGYPPDLTEFDMDLIIYINTYLAILTQIGVGPEQGFSISDRNTKWGDYIGNDDRLNMVHTYLYLRVKLVFDPPQSSATSSAFKETADQLEWRLKVQADPPNISN